MIIENDRVVTISYTLKNASGETLDASSTDDPLVYLHGNENIIPGLEKELTGKKAGDVFKVIVQPEDGYGQRTDELMGVVPRSVFEGAGELAVGMRFQAQDGNGSHIVVITGIDGDDISIDENHPLAGMTLHFEGNIMDVREATAEEKAAGGIDMGCSCGEDGCEEGSCDDGSCGCGCH